MPGAGIPPSVHLYVGDEDIVASEAIALTGVATQGHVASKSHRAPYERQLADFCHAVRDHREPFVGQEGKKCIELIETCYALRQAIDYPWKFAGKDMPARLSTPHRLEAAS